MKTIYLIRHAKSDQSLGTLADIDRPLNLRGYTDADKMSKLMKEKKLIPELIISSPAVRAISTALIFSRNLDYYTGKISIIPQLYHPASDNYLSTIAETDSKINTLMLFAHNPILTNTVNNLTKEFIEHVPTCGIVAITNDCDDWEHFIMSTGKLISFNFPKNN